MRLGGECAGGGVPGQGQRSAPEEGERGCSSRVSMMPGRTSRRPLRRGAPRGTTPAAVRGRSDGRMAYANRENSRPHPDRPLPIAAEAFLQHAVACYQSDRVPVDVSFRRLLPDLKYGERATHFLHPYPGKLLAHIPYFFLRARGFVGPRTRVLDPFCGSGTTLVESLIRGVSAHGLDVNPFAALLSQAKVTYVDEATALRAVAMVLGRLEKTMPSPRNILNPALWYAPNTYQDLLRLRAAIDTLDDPDVLRLLLVCLATTARVLSFADPRVPVPVRVRSRDAKSAVLRRHFEAVEKRATLGDARTVFLEAVIQSLGRLENLRALVPSDRAEISIETGNVLQESRLAPASRWGQYDLVITSPPYCGAQKYIRSTANSIAWTSERGLSTLGDLEAASIGREHVRAGDGDKVVLPERAAAEVVERIAERNPARARIAATYISEMDAALFSIARGLQPGGHAVFVMGDNHVAGMPFPATKLITSGLERAGLKTLVVLRDKIPSRGLMTKRNSTGSPIACEHVIVMQKPEGCS